MDIIGYLNTTSSDSDDKNKDICKFIWETLGCT